VAFSWKRSVVDGLVGVMATMVRSRDVAPPSPRAIFVLRNNDIGDLIVVTPLFEALKKRFPSAQIVVGVGDWVRPVLENNPYVDAVLSVNAPWHNLVIQPQSPMRSLRYILRSTEGRRLRAARFDVGIDVLGSPWGSLLLMRAGIPWRLGVRGYAGGHRGVQGYVDFDLQMPVGRAALRFAELLGATELPHYRPQLYVTPEEVHRAETRWRTLRPGARGKRIVIGPGGGFPDKCWPPACFAEVATRLARDASNQVVVVGGRDQADIGVQVAQHPGVSNLVGSTTLRELFALVERADLVISNSSMLMHVAAAFEKPAVVVLGEAMPPPRQHAAAWASSELTIVCGRERREDALPSPDDILAVVASALARVASSASA
jgi:lipopolysaccharide heptosyltransferase II